MKREGLQIPKKKGIGLALSGGAARCIAQLGVLEVLEREGIPIQAIAGTSGGSLMGALYASGQADIHSLQELARSTKWRKMIRAAIPRMGLISSESLYRFIRKLIGACSFEDLAIPLAVVTSDLRSGEKVVLTSGSVARAVQASCALPVIFTPARIHGQLLVDGGAVSQLPVRTVRDVLKTPFAVGVDVNCNDFESAPLRNMFQIGVHFLCLIARRNAAVERRDADVMIEVDPGDISLYNLHKSRVLIEKGRQAAEEKIDEIKDLLRGRPATAPH